jgi:DNA-binding transcriptional LysR family regulator
LLLDFTEETVRQAGSLRHELGAASALVRGRIRLPTAEVLLSSFVADAVTQFALTHAGIIVEIPAAGSQSMAQFVAEGNADLGLTFGPSPGPTFVS